MEAQLTDLLDRATAPEEPAGTDPTRERILDAALDEAAAVGLQRMTVEDVVRRARLGRMTVYRRFARREDLVEALVVRECRRFLSAVADGIAGVDPDEGVAAAFVAAMRFVREHPLMRRAATVDPGGVVESVVANDAQLLRMGRGFIATQIRTADPSISARRAERVADVYARLFVTYVAFPPTDPDPNDDKALWTFADAMLVPLLE